MEKSNQTSPNPRDCTEKMCPEREHLIRSLFDEYIEMYASRDKRLISHFSDDFSGYAGSSDALITDKSEWIRITLQDFAQIPNRINIEVLNLSLQSLTEDVVNVTAFFHIHLPFTENILSNKTARLVLIFRCEKAAWKIVHSGISIPYELANSDEIYPMSQLEKRNLELENIISVRTKELSEANRLLKIQTNTDGLTNINNRRHFDYLLKQEWNRGQRQGTLLMVIMLDVDYFKSFNDHYGHLAGDDCLKRIGLVLRESTRRGGELVARYGGEEFVVIVPNTDEKAAFELAQRIQKMISSMAIPHVASSFGIVTVSIGVASLNPSSQQLPKELVRLADEALYRAKSTGRNRIEMEGVVSG